jgi:hypothetical protein
MILVHAIIYRTWDVARFYSDPLSLWTPTSSSSDQALSWMDQPPKYLATIPQFSNWRNAACDCLDILHWEALGISAKAGGVEGPTFLILHLSRLVLLAPVKELEGLVQAMLPSTQPLTLSLPHETFPPPQSLDDCQAVVRIWARSDRFKARLAALHSGAIFWHVRHYASASFIRPFTIFLATIILWAHGTYGSQNPQAQISPPPDSMPQGTDDDVDAIEGTRQGDDLNSSPSSVSSRRTTPSSLRFPKFMHIDRPFDDEIAQHFIRSGESMKVFLEGVGDLNSATGPKLILREGAHILRMRSSWTIAEHYANRLDALACVSL